MKVPQGSAPALFPKKVFLEKKEKKEENIPGSHLRESKLTHIIMICSPLFALFSFFTFHA